ncbi:MAG TPA: hypothetical protein VK541_11645 [Pedobacter sp.]|uniref:hypothetical protein n=1 Tax=Pedobacter sp. TaxID=1411316 RepID=UPI002D08C649|nr:hypothetical protein [Pedobacter sp.]HMI03130.1 hypothetical protein [Pedobacter sp.]
MGSLTTKIPPIFLLQHSQGSNSNRSRQRNVNSFKTGSTLTILIQATTDSNGDKKFGEDDDDSFLFSR